MITTKQQALEEVRKPRINFDKFDKKLLRDKDIALEYMKHHSSNDMLLKDFPIDIDSDGMIDDFDFVMTFINNLDVDYSKNSLMYMLKGSATRIVKAGINRNPDDDIEHLKQLTKDILTEYNSAVKSRAKQLEQKQSKLHQIDEYADDIEMDAFDAQSQDSDERYRRCKIGFTADMK